MAYYHLIPESVYVMTSATSQSTRAFTAMGRVYEYHRLKRSFFIGYEPIKEQGEVVLMATPEKALVDYLYFVDLKKKVLNDRLILASLSWKQIERWLKLCERPSLLQLARTLR